MEGNLGKEALSNNSVRLYHRVISGILSEAEKEGLVAFNVGRRATVPKGEKKAVNYYQMDELRQILEAFDKEPVKVRLVPYLLATTGIRLGELAGISWSNIDFEKGTILIDKAVSYGHDGKLMLGKTKTGKSRMVRLVPEVAAMLKQHKREQSEIILKAGDYWERSDLVFTNLKGGVICTNVLGYYLKRVERKYNLPHMNPHAFRHTHASLLIHNGVDVVSVSKALGHAKVSTTSDIYAKVMDESNQKVVDTIEKVIFHRAIK